MLTESIAIQIFVGWGFGVACGLQVAAMLRGTGLRQLPITLAFGLGAAVIIWTL
jgi:hypothetical protein